MGGTGEVCLMGVRSTGLQTIWATTNWATHFSQLDDNAPELNLGHFVFLFTEGKEGKRK